MESEVNCVELFAGAGGAALGIEAAGFTHLALCEWDKDACATLRAAGLGPVLEGDVREQDWDQYRGRVDMLWSSFPCQAWSTAGKRDGANDERNMWPATMDACDDMSPTWFIAENVPGLTYHRAECEQDPRSNPLDCPGCYFERIILMDLADRFDWVEVWKLDAADFGVPQHRSRIFMVAGPHYVKRPIATHCDPGLRLLTVTGMPPWVSVRQALGIVSSSTLIDQPSPAVCAMPNGKGCGQWSADQQTRDRWEAATSQQWLSLKDAGKLQGFPDHYPFQGTQTTTFSLIGNAVPPSLAQAVAGAIYSMSTSPSVSNSGSSTSTSPSTGSGSAAGSTS